MDAVKTEKGKHVVVEIGGVEPTTLRFHAGSKDAAEAVVKKMERSIDISTEISTEIAQASSSAAAQDPVSPTLTHHAIPFIDTTPEEPQKKNQVHFAVSSPSIITRSEYGEEDIPTDAIQGVALYDFTAGGEDELTVNEGDRLWVMDKSNEDWWSCRNEHGLEGVVPASYIEVSLYAFDSNQLFTGERLQSLWDM